MKKLQFKDQELKFDAQLYIKSKDHAMRFLAWDGQCQFVATVYIPGLTGREVAIKNYAENEGIEQALIDQGFLELPMKRTEQSGLVNINVYNLSLEALQQYEKVVEELEPFDEGETSFDENRFIVRGPEGLEFERDQEPYLSLIEVFIAIQNFIKRFKKQGYYSARYDRIDLIDIPASCTISILSPDGTSELMGTEEWLPFYFFFEETYQIIYDTVKKEFDEEKYHTNHALPATNEAINSKGRHQRAFYAAADPNDRGGTGHGDMSHSDADSGM